MYNMEIYCTRLVQFGSSIQYRLVQYLSIKLFFLYNNLLIEKTMSYGIGNHCSGLRYAQRYGGVKVVYGFIHPLDDYI